jgi:HD-GYP domain-containing protein (c-di-GMP phosphodiesterase class II)/ABC-type amino acid transport substrate-binding protein
MKKVAFVVFLFSVITFVSFSANAITLKVGTYDDVPLSFKKNGNVTGIYIELLNYIAKEEGWNIVYEYGTLGELLEELKEGKIDLLTSVAYSPERAKYAYFSKETVYVNWANICQRDDKNFSNIFSLRGKKVGVVSGDIYYVGPEGARELFKKFGIPVDFVEFPTYTSVLKALEERKVDVGVVNRFFVTTYGRKYHVKGTSIIFDPLKLIFAASKKKPELLNVLNEIDLKLREMKRDQSSEYYKVITKFTAYRPEFFGMPKWIVEALIYGLIAIGLIAFFLTYTNHILKIKVKKATADLVKRNKELKSFNERLKEAQLKLQKSVQMENRIREKYFEMLKLLSLQSDLLEDEEDVFMEKVLSTAILVLEGDYGSVNKVENGKWKFISAVGHNKNGLNSLSLDAKYIFRSSNEMILDIKKYNDERLPPEISKAITKNAKPIKQTIFIPLSVGEIWDGNMCVDLAKNSPKTFSKEDLEVAKAFQEIAKVFLTIKLNSDLFRKAYIEFAQRLASIAESYDQTTGTHIIRVGEISAFVAMKMGMPPDFVEGIREFAPLHDIGKILIAKEILKKPAKLSQMEWEEMKKHTVYAKKILSMKYFEMALKIALYHHENYDGSGYPYGLKGEQIPIEAQIVHIVDVYDALRSTRPYKKAFSQEEAMKIITNGDARISPTHFHPKVLEIFVENADEINGIYERISKGNVN